MRIIAGYLKSRKIAQPSLDNTRPTSDRVRESIFNMLSHQLLLHNQTFAISSVLDLFAGSGAMGLEAASRGCQQVTCVDYHSAALHVLQTNVNTLNMHGIVTILRLDALKLPMARMPFSLIFLDPPYGRNLIVKTLDVLHTKNWIANKALIVCESSPQDIIKFDHCFTLLATRAFGHCHIHIIKYNKLD